MKSAVAHRMSALEGESAFDVMAKAEALEAAGQKVIHLEIGQPDFRTPPRVIEAAYKALREGHTGYTDMAGILPLREAVVDYCAEKKHVKTNVDEVVVVGGAKPTLFFAMMLLVEPGDEVIYPDPSYPTYHSLINFCGAKAVPMPLTESNGFRPDFDALKAAITDRTKLIIINSPANPTGGVFHEDDIRRIADMVLGKGIYVLSDEIYDRFYFGDKPPMSIAAIPEMKDHTILMDGFSKAYSMTGWRLGFSVMAPELAREVVMMIANSTSCAANMTQWAGVEALRSCDGEVAAMRDSFKMRSDFVVKALNSIKGVRCFPPEGAFYAFPNISSFGLSSDEFADRLLREFGVALLSGAGFGTLGEGFLRISCATSMENLEKSMELIDRFTRTL